jgi:hypothetical protein
MLLQVVQVLDACQPEHCMLAANIHVEQHCKVLSCASLVVMTLQAVQSSCRNSYMMWREICFEARKLLFGIE